ncbi:lasso RiPP family leader peptide-containing protein [uncultured Erythrobacter sp.]|nr:lasso RiPP family leader peptide-containing protein [uncultured Erythrobacter sp.]
MTKTIQKAKYEAPRLTVFGSVRNLTGGSASSFRDGAVTNVRF